VQIKAKVIPANFKSAVSDIFLGNCFCDGWVDHFVVYSEQVGCNDDIFRRKHLIVHNSFGYCNSIKRSWSSPNLNSVDVFPCDLRSIQLANLIAINIPLDGFFRKRDSNHTPGRFKVKNSICAVFNNWLAEAFVFFLFFWFFLAVRRQRVWNDNCTRRCQPNGHN